jgi:hypothetical protein
MFVVWFRLWTLLRLSMLLLRPRLRPLLFLTLDWSGTRFRPFLRLRSCLRPLGR